MKPGKFIFISGRTLKQGRALHMGKHSEEYMREVSSLEMNEQDMSGLMITEGDRVKVRSAHGMTTSCCRGSEALPPGIVFMPYGPPANLLSGAETGGTGMPDYKGIEVEIWR